MGPKMGGIAPLGNRRVSIDGQSNAGGKGIRADISSSPLSSDTGLAAFDAGTFARVYIWEYVSKTYQLLTPATNNYAESTAEMGPEFGLAVRWMRETTSGKLFIDKFYDGGQPISTFAKGLSDYSYILTAKPFQDAWLVANSITYKRSGWLWVQGESDMALTQAAYETPLITLITNTIADGLITAAEPRVLAQMGVASATYGAGVAAAKADYAANNPTTTSTVTMVNHMNADNIHLNAQGQLQLGYDAYEKFFNRRHKVA